MQTNRQKSVAFQYTSEQHAEKKIKETLPFKREKEYAQPGKERSLQLTFNTSKKEKDTRRWEALQSLWTRRSNSTKAAILPNAECDASQISDYILQRNKDFKNILYF